MQRNARNQLKNNKTQACSTPSLGLGPRPRPGAPTLGCCRLAFYCFSRKLSELGSRLGFGVQGLGALLTAAVSHSVREGVKFGLADPAVSQSSGDKVFRRVRTGFRSVIWSDFGADFSFFSSRILTFLNLFRPFRL